MEPDDDGLDDAIDVAIDVVIDTAPIADSFAASRPHSPASCAPDFAADDGTDLPDTDTDDLGDGWEDLII